MFAFGLLLGAGSFCRVLGQRLFAVVLGQLSPQDAGLVGLNAVRTSHRHLLSALQRKRGICALFRGFEEVHGMLSCEKRESVH